MDCLFCKIVTKELPGLVVYEDKDSLAFLELFPSAPGHTMVVLKKHGNSILDYNEQELGKLMISAQKVALKLQKALKCDSITIGINHLEKRGVPHLHIHLIPRWEDDKGGIIQSVVKNEPKETREQIADKIRKA